MPFPIARGSAVLALLICVCAARSATAQVTFVRQPYLQQATHSGIVIVWATRENGDASVRYGRAGGSTQTVPATTTRYAASHTGLPYDLYQHEASLFGLASGTDYVYDVLMDGQDVTSGSDRFRTAPVPGSGTVRFIAFGDSGTGSTAQRTLAARMAAEPFDLALHTGDIAYGRSDGTGNGTYATLNAWFFGVYPDWLRRSTMFPSMGNHDLRADTIGIHYLNSFVLPENASSGDTPDPAERYYSFDYGPVHFVALDTEYSFEDATRRARQLEWLERDLAATTQPWKIAYFHRAPFSAGAEHGSDTVVRQAFVPLFERYGVQLVISGHEHNYERTRPVPLGDPDGVTYIVTGAGGASLYGNGSASWTAFSKSAWHYVRGEVSGCELDLEAVGTDGVVFDSVTLDRCAEPPPAPTLPEGWRSLDIGSVGRPGSAGESAGTFTVRGAGADIWGSADAFHYAYRTLAADGTIVARVADISGTEAWAKAGVMIRQSTTAGSPHAFMLVSAGKGVAFQRRRIAGGLSTNTPGGSGTAPEWVKLQRSGNTIIGFVSSNGASWTEVGRDTFSMPSDVLVGLATSSHTTATVATGTFDSVSVTAGTTPTPGSLPSGWSSRDVGAVGKAGAASASGGTFTVSGAGADVWGTSDAFHYAYRTLSGDGTIVARVATSDGTEAWTKVGVMIRGSTDHAAAHAFMLVSEGKGLAFQRRRVAGGLSTGTSGGAGTAPRWVRLQRLGSIIIGSVSSDGTRWTEVGRDTFTMPSSALVGLAVSSHTSSATATAIFDNVTVTAGGTAPALPAGWQSQDIGAVGTTGSAAESGGTFTLRGAGEDIWGTSDAFHYAYYTLSGDGTIVARVATSNGTEAWTKVGVMIRGSTDHAAAHAFMLVSEGKGLAFQRRRVAGGLSTGTPGGAGTAPRWVKLQRVGSTIIGSVSSDGTSWAEVGRDTFTMPSSALVGLAVSSHTSSAAATATFDHVQVTP